MTRISAISLSPVSWKVVGTVFFVSASVYVTRIWWGERVRPRRDPVAELSRVVQDDPSIGTSMRLQLRSRLGYGTHILVFAPLCACDEQRLAILKGRIGGLPVSIVAPVPEAQFDRLPSLATFRDQFVFDPDYQLLLQFNARFMPRAYVLSESRLAWKSTAYRADWLDLVWDAEAAASRVGAK